MLGRALGVWLLIVLAESANGAVRALWISPVLGDGAARRLGFFVGCGLILLLAWATAPWLGARRSGQQFAVGGLWAVLTFAFEVGLGLALGLELARILAEYRPGSGLMAWGMLWLILAPALGARLRRATGAAVADPPGVADRR